MVERQFDGLLRATPDLELCKTKIKLKTLKKDLPVVGECDVTFENETRATDANIIIVQGKMDSLPLLGRQTLEELEMVKFDASGSLKQPNRETTKNVRKLESSKPEMMKLYLDIRKSLKVSAKHNATVKTLKYTYCSRRRNVSASLSRIT